VSYTATGLAGGTTYVARVTAIDQFGNESACSPGASGTARAAQTVTPTGTTAFGSVAIGATADRTFTVQNVSTVTVSGSATAAAPFSIFSGGTFSLAPGASQAVVVRFRPTTATDVAGNVTFTVDSDAVSRSVSGTGTGSALPTLTVTRTGNGTVTS